MNSQTSIVSSATTVTTRGGGNTNPPSRNSSLRRVCFTLNNYTDDEYADFIDYMTTKKYKYIIGKEIGQNGTPHLQGYIEFGTSLKFRTVKNILPRAHFEKCRGSRKDNLAYCMKDGQYNTNIFIRENPTEVCLREYEGVVWKDWQQDVLDLIETPADRRKIIWYCDRDGNKGKSFLALYIDLTKGCIVADGKKADIFNQCLMWYQDESKPLFQVVIMDISRDGMQYVNYDMIERLKNGLLYSGKYEGGKMHIPPVHLICFANAEPDYNKMSFDRWDVRFI